MAIEMKIKKKDKRKSGNYYESFNQLYSFSICGRNMEIKTFLCL